MIRIHEDSVVPKYPTGKWLWNIPKDELNFASWKSDVLERELFVESSSGFKFKATMNQIEEVIFRQEFTRKGAGDDADVIRIEDIKNLVLFLAPSEFMTKKFIHFIHTVSVDRFLNALIIYFEYFLRLVEFILIRRDEVSGSAAQVESTDSTKIKRIFSEHLAQYRIILAREYSEIIIGNGEMSPYYHLNRLVKISKTLKDQLHHEIFLAFATQVAWIAHHRRGYDIIDTEINRLFRSHHFKLNRKDAIVFSKIEQDLLFGNNNKHVNCRWQNSPLIQEIANVRRQNLPILWIGEKKYRGNDLRMQQLELEFIIPDGDLCLIDVKHGILGNQQVLYNTMLNLDWDAVRKREYTPVYDPYQLATQPYMVIPKLDGVKQAAEHFESYFSIKDKRFQHSKASIRRWIRRDQIVNYIKGGGLVIDVISKCKYELAKSQPVTVSGLTKAFQARLKFLPKKS